MRTAVSRNDSLSHKHTRWLPYASRAPLTQGIIIESTYESVIVTWKYYENRREHNDGGNLQIQLFYTGNALQTERLEHWDWENSSGLWRSENNTCVQDVPMSATAVQDLQKQVEGHHTKLNRIVQGSHPVQSHTRHQLPSTQRIGASTAEKRARPSWGSASRLAAAKTVYSATLRLPGEFFSSSFHATTPADPSIAISWRVTCNNSAQYLLASHRARVLCQKYLNSATHVFIWEDGVCKPL